MACHLQSAYNSVRYDLKRLPKIVRPDNFRRSVLFRVTFFGPVSFCLEGVGNVVRIRDTVETSLKIQGQWKVFNLNKKRSFRRKAEKISLKKRSVE